MLFAVLAVLLSVVALTASESSCSRSEEETLFYDQYAVNSDIQVSVDCSHRNVTFNWYIPSMDTIRMIIEYTCSDNPNALMKGFDAFGTFLNGTSIIEVDYNGSCTYSGCVFDRKDQIPTNFTSISCTRNSHTTISDNNSTVASIESSAAAVTSSSSQLHMSISPTSSQESSFNKEIPSESASPSIHSHDLLTLYLTSTTHSTSTASYLFSDTSTHPSLIKSVATPLVVIFSAAIFLGLSVLVYIVYRKRKSHRTDREIMKNCADFYDTKSSTLDSSYVLNSTRGLSRSSSVVTVINSFTKDNEYGEYDSTNIKGQIDRPTSLFLHQHSKINLDSCLTPSSHDISNYNFGSNEVYETERCDNICEVVDHDRSSILEKSTSSVQHISINTMVDLSSGLSSRRNSVIFHLDMLEEGQNCCDHPDNAYVHLSLENFGIAAYNEDGGKAMVPVESPASFLYFSESSISESYPQT